MNLSAFGIKTTIATSFFSLLVSFYLVLFYSDNSQQNTSGGWSTLYTLCLPAVVVFCAATLLILAARATMVTWITVLVLLAFAGKRRRVLVQEGRKITTDVAFYFIKGCA
ncbi:hypothetical protein Pint_15541 [Pistacia integerrima]|uniref:Uncharacterized protein n=1 Tax=Pistacia integerrima TaxID=434235 RepID=A0ACC0ZD81_9ROSI|nr:hypothetical protein Pint_15541 [Pistacia integerrima]